MHELCALLASKPQKAKSPKAPRRASIKTGLRAYVFPYGECVIGEKHFCKNTWYLLPDNARTNGPGIPRKYWAASTAIEIIKA